MKRIFLALTILLFFGLVSCDSNRVYQQAYDFDETGWLLDTIPEFNFQIEDTERKNILLNLRYSVDYKEYNIYLNYTLEDSTGTEISSELISMDLFDAKTGRPLGEGSSIYQRQVPVLENYRFDNPGRYTFKVIQYTRENPVQEIYSVGVRVEEAED